MRPSLLVLSLLLLFAAACGTPPPSGNTLVSVSWHNPTPQSFRFAEVSLGPTARPVVIEEIPPYSEISADTAIPLSTRPQAHLVFQQNGRSIRPPVLSLGRPLRRDPRNEYHLRILLLDAVAVSAELEPASVARLRLNRVSPAPAN